VQSGLCPRALHASSVTVVWARTTWCPSLWTSFQGTGLGGAFQLLSGNIVNSMLLSCTYVSAYKIYISLQNRHLLARTKQFDIFLMHMPWIWGCSIRGIVARSSVCRGYGTPVSVAWLRVQMYAADRGVLYPRRGCECECMPRIEGCSIRGVVARSGVRRGYRGAVSAAW
jgi:hypothetical protein